MATLSELLVRSWMAFGYTPISCCLTFKETERTLGPPTQRYLSSSWAESGVVSEELSGGAFAWERLLSRMLPRSFARHQRTGAMLGACNFGAALPRSYLQQCYVQ